MSGRKSKRSKVDSVEEVESNGGHYFTLAIILLPSFLAVLVPVIPNSPSDNDVAILTTDVLIILVVTWIVKFVAEWPWNWRKQIKTSKEILINNLNSVMLMHLADSFKPHIRDNIMAAKKLIWYEKLAMFYCFLGVAAGGLLMVVTRSLIIVEERRKSIVFSNLNITVFTLWGCCRIITTILESVKQKSLSSGDNEYHLIDEFNLDEYLELQPPQEFIWPGYFMQFLQRLFASRSFEVEILEEKLHQNENLFKSTIAKHQRDIEVLTKKLESVARQLETSRRIKPFPLNLQDSTKSPVNVKSNLTTIFEHEEPKAQPRAQPKTQQSMFTPSTPSLHGISQFKNMSTARRVATELNDYNLEYHLAVSLSLNDTWETLLSDISKTHQRIKHKYSLKFILMYPATVVEIFNSELIPLFKRFKNSPLSNLSKAELIGSLWIKLLTDYIFADIITLLNYTKEILLKPFVRGKKFCKFVVHIVVEVPYQVTKTVYRVVFFIPRVGLSMFRSPEVDLEPIKLVDHTELLDKFSLRELRLHHRNASS